MTEPELDYLRAFLKARSGLALGPEKRYLVDSRLGPLCKRNALRDLSELVSRLKLGCDRALERSVVDAMATNETFFFRDRVPFDLFRDVLLPRCVDAASGSRKIRIWCAAASSGQ
ncbi:MAG TPA: CheR family methyltransferase, partial [Beijerinckiaceae bacterium]|nr:CheR family methyltransferase [Beijerinckiaceae bacterium]